MTLSPLLGRYVGDRAFYRRILGTAIPMIIQNGITNFVSLLDNIMVGQVGTLPMNGVSIVNQLLFVFNLSIFGAASGAGIFTAQFHGSGDPQGVRHTFRFKLYTCLGLTLVGIGVFWLGGQPLISLYLTGEGDPYDAAMSLAHGLNYLRVMLLGLLPFALCNAYATTLRETGETRVPMVGGIVAVVVNLSLNYVLIFGHLGAPAMGVRGAALATVISRYVELTVVAGWTHLHKERNPFIVGAYASLGIPKDLLLSICRKGAPLLCNEFLWASGMAVLNQCYSTCGLEVVPAMNICNTIYNLASVTFLSIGNAVGILMGQMLGAGRPEPEVREENRKLILVGVAAGAVFGLLLAALAWPFPYLYNTTGEIRALATQLILVSAGMMPFWSYTNAAYFTLRSGGKTLVTFLFDSCFVWGCCVPLAFLLSRFTGMPIVPLYLLCNATEILKCLLGAWMLHKGAWIQNLAKVA